MQLPDLTLTQAFFLSVLLGFGVSFGAVFGREFAAGIFVQVYLFLKSINENLRVLHDEVYSKDRQGDK